MTNQSTPNISFECDNLDKISFKVYTLDVLDSVCIQIDSKEQMIYQSQGNENVTDCLYGVMTIDYFFADKGKHTINIFGNVYGLNVKGCNIFRLDLNDCKLLEHLDCHSNDLEMLDLMYCPRLIRVDCSNNRLIDIDLHNNKRLSYLKCNNNKICRLETTYLINLRTLLCAHNNIDKISFTFNGDANYIDMRDNNLSRKAIGNAINTLSRCKNAIFCDDYPLTSLDEITGKYRFYLGYKQ